MCLSGESLASVKWGEKRAQKEIFLGRVLGVADSGPMRQHHYQVEKLLLLAGMQDWWFEEFRWENPLQREEK